MSEQPPINFDENIENNHEVFTNLPNNTLNGVNPVGLDDNKTDVMENLVTDVKKEVSAAEENAFPNVEAENPVEMPMPAEMPMPIDTPAEAPTPVEAPAEIPVPAEAPVEMPVPAEAPVEMSVPTEAPAEMPTEVSAPIENEVVEQTVVAENPVSSVVDNVISEEQSVNEVPSVEVKETEAPVLPNKNEKKVRLIVFFSILALAIGGALLCLFLIIPTIGTPAGSSSSGDTYGSTGVGSSDYKYYELSSNANNYDLNEITTITADNTFRNLVDENKAIFTVLSNGAVSIINATDASKVSTLKYNNAAFKYYFSFINDGAYYFVSTDGKLFKVVYTLDESQMIDENTVNVTLEKEGVTSVGINDTGTASNIQVVCGTEETVLFENVNVLDKALSRK